MKIVITVDIEKDLGFMNTYYGINEGLPAILDMFKRYGIEATFFVSGEAAEYLYANDFLKEIAKESHEISSHGFAHTDYRTWEYHKIREEVCRSKKVLEGYTGKTVLGYRSPQFLLNKKVVKAIEECGFSYDSSMPDAHGIGAARTLRGVRIDNSLNNAILDSKIREFPIDSIPVLRMPHGLLWVNLISLGIYKRLFVRQKKDFMVFYLHAFDLIQKKRRVAMDIKRRFFYLKNEDGIANLFLRLIEFWIANGVTFWKMEDMNV